MFYNIGPKWTEKCEGKKGVIIRILQTVFLLFMILIKMFLKTENRTWAKFYDTSQVHNSSMFEKSWSFCPCQAFQA